MGDIHGLVSFNGLILVETSGKQVLCILLMIPINIEYLSLVLGASKTADQSVLEETEFEIFKILGGIHALLYSSILRLLLADLMRQRYKHRKMI